MCLNCRAYGHDCSYEPVSVNAKEAGRERHHRSKRRRTSSHNSDLALDDAGSGDAGDRAPGLRSSIISPAKTQYRSPVVQAACESVEQDGGDDHGDDNHTAPETAKRGGVRTPGTSFGSSRAPEASVARILVSDNGAISYHGRTSALFEDNVPDRQAGGDSCPRMPDDWVERGLVAEAARQRM